MLSPSGAGLPGVRGVIPPAPGQGAFFFLGGGVYANVPSLAFLFLSGLAIVFGEGNVEKQGKRVCKLA